MFIEFIVQPGKALGEVSALGSLTAMLFSIANIYT